MKFIQVKLGQFKSGQGRSCPVMSPFQSKMTVHLSSPVHFYSSYIQYSFV